jgi:FkbM family methyltransferase
MSTGLFASLARKVYIHVLSRKRPRFRSMPSPDDSLSVLNCCIAYNRYGGYCVPLSSRHRPAAQRVLSGATYEPATIEFLAARCGDGDIVHAGTYFGDFLPALSRACAPGARVWAFEPNPESYRCALITLQVNGLRNVELNHAGLGERPGPYAMKTRGSGGQALGGASHIVGPVTKNPPAGTETIQIVTLDEVVPKDRKVSIVQLDVEGYEQQALCGALKTLERCRPVLVLERLPEGDWLAANVLRLGYRKSHEIQGNTVLTRD